MDKRGSIKTDRPPTPPTGSPSTIPDKQGTAASDFTKEEIEEIEKIMREGQVKTDDSQRGHFGSRLEYIAATIGTAVGLGNVWRFPYMVYEYGGGAFFVPFLIMSLLVGLPVMVMEAWVGQYSGLSAVVAFRRMCPIARGMGWTHTLTPYFISFYYGNILALIMRYFLASIVSPGWSECGLSELGNTYNTKVCFTREQFEQCREEEGNGMTFWNNSCVSGAVFCESNENICKDKGVSCATSKMAYANRSHCKNKSSTADEFNFVSYEDAIIYESPAQEYWKYQVTGIGDNASWGDYGALHWDILLCLMAVWLLTAAGIMWGAEILGKVMTIVGIIPFFILIIMVVYTASLPGISEGIRFYVEPDLSEGLKLFAWNKAMTQIFFTLSLGQNLVLHFSSYNRFFSNIVENSAMVIIADTGMSVLSGFVVFMVLGYYAFTLGKEVSEIVASGFSLAFIAFPEATNKMPWGPMWAAFFFLLLFLIGINSNFAFLEAMVGSVTDEFPPLLKRKKLLSGGFALLSFVCGISMTFDGGIMMMELIDTSTGQLLILNCLMENIVLIFIFGYSEFEEACEEMFMGMNIVLKWYLRITLCFITPLLLTWGCVWTFVGYENPHYEDYYFEWPLALLWWLMYAFILAPTIILGIYELVNTVWVKQQSWKQVFRVDPQWGPAVDAIQKEMAMGVMDDETKEYVMLTIGKAIRRNKERYKQSNTLDRPGASEA